MCSSLKARAVIVLAEVDRLIERKGSIEVTGLRLDNFAF